MARPTKYKKEYCEKLIEHMSEGLSYESFAGLVKVSKQTIYDWEKANPEFLDAKSRAIEQCRLFWEKEGIEGLYKISEYDDGKKISEKSMNATVWLFNMKNRFGWRDKQPGEEDKVIVNNYNDMSEDELDKKIKKMMGEV